MPYWLLSMTICLCLAWPGNALSGRADGGSGEGSDLSWDIPTGWKEEMQAFSTLLRDSNNKLALTLSTFSIDSPHMPLLAESEARQLKATALFALPGGRGYALALPGQQRLWLYATGKTRFSVLTVGPGQVNAKNTAALLQSMRGKGADWQKIASAAQSGQVRDWLCYKTPLPTPPRQWGEALREDEATQVLSWPQQSVLYEDSYMSGRVPQGWRALATGRGSLTLVDPGGTTRISVRCLPMNPDDVGFPDDIFRTLRRFGAVNIRGEQAILWHAPEENRDYVVLLADGDTVLSVGDNSGWVFREYSLLEKAGRGFLCKAPQ